MLVQVYSWLKSYDAVREGSVPREFIDEEKRQAQAIMELSEANLSAAEAHNQWAQEVAFLDGSATPATDEDQQADVREVLDWLTRFA